MDSLFMEIYRDVRSTSKDDEEITNLYLQNDMLQEGKLGDFVVLITDKIKKIFKDISTNKKKVNKIRKNKKEKDLKLFDSDDAVKVMCNRLQSMIDDESISEKRLPNEGSPFKKDVVNSIYTNLPKFFKSVYKENFIIKSYNRLVLPYIKKGKHITDREIDDIIYRLNDEINEANTEFSLGLIKCVTKNEIRDKNINQVKLNKILDKCFYPDKYRSTGDFKNAEEYLEYMGISSGKAYASLIKDMNSKMMDVDNYIDDFLKDPDSLSNLFKESQSYIYSIKSKYEDNFLEDDVKCLDYINEYFINQWSQHIVFIANAMQIFINYTTIYVDFILF